MSFKEIYKCLDRNSGHMRCTRSEESPFGKNGVEKLYITHHLATILGGQYKVKVREIKDAESPEFEGYDLGEFKYEIDPYAIVMHGSQIGARQNATPQISGLVKQKMDNMKMVLRDTPVLKKNELYQGPVQEPVEHAPEPDLVPVAAAPSKEKRSVLALVRELIDDGEIRFIPEKFGLSESVVLTAEARNHLHYNGLDVAPMTSLSDLILSKTYDVTNYNYQITREEFSDKPSVPNHERAKLRELLETARQPEPAGLSKSVGMTR